MDYSMNWRLITDDNVSASFGLAADDVLVQRVGNGVSQPTLRLYTYRSHCALVGRFQRVENEIHVDFCRKCGIPINRRPTGGGAIIMGDGQLGVALALPGSNEVASGQAREIMARFSAGLVAGLQRLGIQAEFRRKNDIEVNGRKIAGLGIHHAAGGGLIFHASLLVDLDVALMLQVLNTPFEKISDKEIATVAERIATVRRVLGRDISLEEVRQNVAAAYAATFGVELIPGDFTVEELQDTAALEQAKYLTDEWVFQATQVPEANGTAKLKTPGGLLDVHVAMAGRIIKAIFIGGDFFASENAIADLEHSLRWHTGDQAALATTLQQIYRRWESDLEAIPPEGLTEAVQMAVQRALEAQKQAVVRS
jgi:lipoate---protein ligase